MTLAEVILEKNTPYENRLVGAKIPAIDSITAGRMSVLIGNEGKRLGNLLGSERDGIVFLVAAMYQESRCSPKAFNLNLKAPRDAGLILQSIRQKSPWPPALDQGDYGCAQFSLRVAKTRLEFKGMPLDMVMSILFDPPWAVHAMVDQYSMLLYGVKEKYPLVDPRDAAAGVYNRGPMGFACGYAWKFGLPYPDTATPAHTARAPQYWQGAERHFTKIRQHREWFDQHLD